MLLMDATQSVLQLAKPHFNALGTSKCHNFPVVTKTYQVLLDVSSITPQPQELFKSKLG